MITLPLVISKATPLTFTLNKTSVLAGASDTYWKTAANIKKVFVIYKSTTGNQRKSLEFDFSQATPTATATWTNVARSNHDIEQIVLVDFDNDTYAIPTANLPSGKRVSFGSESVLHNYFLDGNVNDMIVDGNNLYIGGAFTALRFYASNAAVMDASTAKSEQIATVLMPTFNGMIRSIVMDGQDTMFVGGDFTQMDGVARNYLAKLIRQNGKWVSDTTWNASGKNQSATKVYCLKIVGNYLLIGTGGTTNTVQYTDGTGTGVPSYSAKYFFAVDKTTGVFQFGANPIMTTSAVSYCSAIEVLGDHIYIAPGCTNTTWPWSTIRRMSLTSKLDNTPATAATLQPDVNIGNKPFVMKVSADGIFVSTGHIRVNSTSGAYNYAPVKLKLSDMSNDSTFAPANSTQAQWSNIRAMEFDSSGNLIVGGNLPTTGYYSGKKNVFKLSKTDGSVITAFDTGTTFVRTGAAAPDINMILRSGSSLYVLGRFDGKAVSTDPATVLNAAKINETTGALDSTFASKTSAAMPLAEYFNGAVLDSGKLIAFGLLEGWGGYTRNGVAKLGKDTDGNWKVDETFNTESGGTIVNSIALSGSSLYVGGSFTFWGTAARNRIVRLSATTGAVDSFGVGTFTSGQTTGQFNGVNSTVYDIKIDGQKVFVCGAFSTYSKKSSASSTINAATPYWIVVDSVTNTETVPAGSAAAINKMVIDLNSIYLGGTIASWGGTSLTRFGVVKVSKDTLVIDTGFSSPITTSTDTVHGMTMFDDKLYIVGYSAAGSILNKTTGALIGSLKRSGGQSLLLGYPIGFSTYNGKLHVAGNYTGAVGVMCRYSAGATTPDAGWGFDILSPTTVGRTICFWGTEVIIGGAGAGGAGSSMFSPSSKLLYSANASTLSLNSNI